jgi:hypothetical protein
MAEGANEMPAVVVTARHGERLDYITRAAGQNWIFGAERLWDTPLTDHGKVHGVKLGKHLAALDRLQLPPVSAIYSSPFLRCRQTAISAKDAWTLRSLLPYRLKSLVPRKKISLHPKKRSWPSSSRLMVSRPSRLRPTRSRPCKIL